MAERKKRANRTATIIKAIIIALVVVLVVLIIFLIWQSILLHRAQELSARELWIANIFRRHGPPTAADVAVIRPWMTFDYINALFRVPPDYLKSQLQINDPTYPRVTISGYAAKNGLDAAAFLQNVDLTLEQYLSMVSSTTTATAATSSQTK